MHPLLKFLRQLYEFMSVTKKWWLAPALVILVLIGVLFVSAQASPLAPLIYTLF